MSTSIGTVCEEIKVTKVATAMSPKSKNKVPFYLNPETELFATKEDPDLPDDSEDTVTILSEMAAQRAVFDVAFQNGSISRAVTYIESTLQLLPTKPERFESNLLVFCLNYCLGNRRDDLIPEGPTQNRWSRRTFESLAIGWMRWMINKGDKDVLTYIANMHEEENDGSSFETLSLNFWAKAIELLVLGRLDDSKRFFDRANEVGAQVGTSINPSICWTYATSFFSTTRTI